MNSYATTSIAKCARQVAHAIKTDASEIDRRVGTIAGRLLMDKQRIHQKLPGWVIGQEILIIGPGPYLVEPHYFGVRNRVTAVDLDVIPRGFEPLKYYQMLRQNGIGRTVKTIGRKLLGVDRAYARAWKRELHIERFPDIKLLQGDITYGPPDIAAYDIAASWAVLQSVPKPARAIRSMIAALRPGGVLYFHVHLWTSNTGHNDIRAFTGAGDTIPPWAHLRPSTVGQFTQGAYLNRWRLDDWRVTMGALCPGFSEWRETYGDAARSLLTPAVRDELRGFSDEDLLTVELYFRWKKP